MAGARAVHKCQYVQWPCVARDHDARSGASGESFLLIGADAPRVSARQRSGCNLVFRSERGSASPQLCKHVHPRGQQHSARYLNVKNRAVSARRARLRSRVATLL